MNIIKNGISDWWLVNGKRAQGLVEILIAVVCFIAAAIPIISVFSFSMENAKIIQAKSITYSAASEILNQVILMPVNLLEKKAGGTVIPIPSNAKTFYLVENNGKTRFTLTPLPPGFTREITINQRDDELESFQVVVTVKSTDQQRGNIEMGQTVSRNFGGK